VPRILCIDTGSYSIKSLLMETGFKRYQMLEFHETVLPEEIRNIEESVKSRAFAIKEHIEGNYSRHEMEEIAIYGMISGDKTVVKLLTFPFRDKVKIKQALQFELENYVPFDLEQWAVAHCIQSGDGKEAYVLAIITGKNDVKNAISEYSDIEYEPEIITTDSLVIANLDELNLYKEQSYALINVGHRKTNVTVVENGAVSLIRSVPVGGYHLTREISRACKIPFFEAEKKKHREARVFNEDEMEQVKEKDRAYYGAVLSFSYDLSRLLKQSIYSLKIQDRGMISRIYLSGGTARVRGLDRFISNDLRVAVSDCMIGGLEGNKIGIDFDKNLMPALFAMGLTDIVKKPVSEINFRKGEFACSKKDEGKKRIIKRIISYSVASLCLLLCLFITMCTVRRSKEKRIYSDISKELKKAFPDIHKKVVKGRSVSRRKIKKISIIMKEEKRKIDRDLHLFNELEKSKLSSIDVLREMSVSIPVDLKFDIFKFEYGNNKVAIEANAPRLNSVSEIVKALERNGNFKNVRESETKAAPTGKGQNFKLRFGIK